MVVSYNGSDWSEIHSLRVIKKLWSIIALRWTQTSQVSNASKSYDSDLKTWMNVYVEPSQALKHSWNVSCHPRMPWRRWIWFEKKFLISGELIESLNNWLEILQVDEIKLIKRLHILFIYDTDKPLERLNKTNNNFLIKFSW